MIVDTSFNCIFLLQKPIPRVNILVHFHNTRLVKPIMQLHGLFISLCILCVGDDQANSPVLARMGGVSTELVRDHCNGRVLYAINKRRITIDINEL